MARCDEVEEEFAKLRDYFRGRHSRHFDMQDLDDELHSLAWKGRTVTYGRLMRRYGISRGGKVGIGNILDILNERERCRSSCRNSLHHISAVVVLANTDYPSGGFFGVDGLPQGIERSERLWTRPALSPREKEFVERVWEHVEDCMRRRDAS